jgi:hypothetical protein
MLDKIDHITCIEDDGFLSWEINKNSVIKKFPFKIFAEILPDKSGVVVVERVSANDPNNAVIFDANGDERVRINNPIPNDCSSSFTDIYYVKDELSLTITTRLASYLCFINSYGECIKIHETR